MKKLHFSFSTFAVILAASAVVSCGAHSSSQPPVLQSITLSPTTADAKEYSDGLVPFVATGNYIDPVRKVTPQSATWGVCQQNAPTKNVTVSQTGVAQCAAGATGKYTIFAYDMTVCNLLNECGGGCTIRGTAQLTCP